MSSHDRDFASLLYQIAVSFDGAVLGAALAYAAVRTFLGFRYTSKALRKIRTASPVKVSGLPDLLKSQQSDQEQENHVVIVRGNVEVKSALDGKNWKNFANSNGALVSQESGDKAVVIQRTQTVRSYFLIIFSRR